jgi:hypothetical protein
MATINFSEDVTFNVDGSINVLDSNGNVANFNPQKTAALTANSSLLANDPVSINRSGTIQKFPLDNSFNNGDVVSFSSVSSGLTSIVYGSAAVYLGNSKFVLASGNSGGLNLVVAEHNSGGSFTFGTAIDISGVSYTEAWPRLIKLDANRFAACYIDSTSSGDPWLIVGTVSGTTITLGTPYRATTSNYSYPDIELIDTDKIAFLYGPYVRIFEINGTSITSIEQKFLPINTSSVTASITKLDTNKFVIAAPNISNTEYGTAIVGEVSGVTITLGTPVIYSSNRGYYSRVKALSPTKVLVVYSDFLSPAYGVAKIGTISGNSISFGSAHVFSNNYATRWLDMDLVSNDIALVAYENDTVSDRLSLAKITIASDDTITSTTQDILVSGSFLQFTEHMSIAIGDDYLVIPHEDGTVVGELSKTTITLSENFLGFSKYAANANESAIVYLKGTILSGLSGLTPGGKYYLNNDGTLALSANTNVFAGTALSATELLIKK